MLSYLLGRAGDGVLYLECVERPLSSSLFFSSLGRATTVVHTANMLWAKKRPNNISKGFRIRQVTGTDISVGPYTSYAVVPR